MSISESNSNNICDSLIPNFISNSKELTACSRILEKLTIAQLVNILLAFFRNRKLMTVFTTNRHWPYISFEPYESSQSSFFMIPIIIIIIILSTPFSPKWSLSDKMLYDYAFIISHKCVTRSTYNSYLPTAICSECFVQKRSIVCGMYLTV
jgi:hypothetical protein